MKYFTFSGRASRSEYWWFALFVVLASAVLTVIDAAAFGADPETHQPNAVISGVFQLAMFLPLLTAGWRRLHDTGRPGWYILLPMVLSVIFVVGLLSGVITFGLIEGQGVDPDTLRGPAIVLGLAGMAVFGVAQVVLLVLMIWWLTRPSDDRTNPFGPKPAS
jgi:uncharacterized membrane protein YhaH (DUF805 family)